MHNQKLAKILENIADELERQDENPYKIRAYRRAADTVQKHHTQLKKLLKNNVPLETLPNVGNHIADLLTHLIKDKEFTYLPKAQPVKMLPKKYRARKKSPAFKIYLLTPIIEGMLEKLRQLSYVIQIVAAGDYRRKKEMVRDISFVAVTNDKDKLFTAFHYLPIVRYITDIAANKTTVQLKNGSLATLHVVDAKNFGTKLLALTGSTAHYDALKALSLPLSGKTEEKIYQQLKLPFILPELREGRGEVEAAQIKQLPNLVVLGDIKGDLHCHTNETDGINTIAEMVAAARLQGYEYVGISDHSQSLKITRGMDETRLLKQIELINEMNASLKDLVILKSMEVDILENGDLDLSNDVLKELDYTVCSVHSKFKLSCDAQTERIIRAMDNPYFNILGHATGRLIQHRPPYPLDVERVLLAAKERGIHIEVNAQPARLDINDIYCKQAKEIGVKVSIASDAHSQRGFTLMILGVNQARRGWLEAKDVINTYHLAALKNLFKRP